MLGGVACRGALLAGRVEYRNVEGGVDKEAEKKKKKRSRGDVRGIYVSHVEMSATKVQIENTVEDAATECGKKPRVFYCIVFVCLYHTGGRFAWVGLEACAPTGFFLAQ